MRRILASEPIFKWRKHRCVTWIGNEQGLVRMDGCGLAWVPGNPVEYPKDVLTQLPSILDNELSRLTPANWQKNKAAQFEQAT